MTLTNTIKALKEEFPNGSVVFINEYYIPGDGWFNSKKSGMDYHEIIVGLKRIKATRVCLTIKTGTGDLVEPDFEISKLISK